MIGLPAHDFVSRGASPRIDLRFINPLSQLIPAAARPVHTQPADVASQELLQWQF